MDPRVQRMVADKVAELINNNAVFTAFDVTQAVRAEGVYLFHRDVKELVHLLFENAAFGEGYERTNETLKTARGSEGAWVYHPAGARASDHPLSVNNPDPPEEAPADPLKAGRFFAVEAAGLDDIVGTRRRPDPPAAGIYDDLD